VWLALNSHSTAIKGNTVPGLIIILSVSPLNQLGVSTPHIDYRDINSLMTQQHIHNDINIRQLHWTSELSCAGSDMIKQYMFCPDEQLVIVSIEMTPFCYSIHYTRSLEATFEHFYYPTFISHVWITSSY
jgi:hypothetical protein